MLKELSKKIPDTYRGTCYTKEQTSLHFIIVNRKVDWRFWQGRPTFLLTSVKVDHDGDVVDGCRGISKPMWSTKHFKALLHILEYGMATAASPTSGEKREEDDKKKKLTKVLSTKLSVEDYIRFQKYTRYAYEAGMIDEPKTSKYLRYIVTYPFNELGLH